MGKSILGSKTVWLNVITFILVVIALPEFKSTIPAQYTSFLALIAAIGNTVLRIWFTNQEITSFLPKDKPIN